MARRDEFVPEDFVLHLANNFPGFSNESIKHRMAVAKMLWESTGKVRMHSEFAGHLSFSHYEIDLAFGRRKFGKLNGRLKLFVVTRWSHEDGYTKGYRLMPKTSLVLKEYFERTWDEGVRLIYGNGLELKNIPEAISSKDMNGVTVRRWKGTESLSLVPINIERLEELRVKLLGLRNKADRSNDAVGIFAKYMDVTKIERDLDSASQVLRLSKTKVAGYGRMMHRYVQSGSGRLYAKGVSLQTVPKIVKRAALHGLWEFDFSNCHYSILYQMASGFGVECEEIDYYLKNKSSVRKDIASKSGISEKDTKKCLLAIIYGACLALRHKNAIPDAIGVDAARRLYSVNEFLRIHSDIVKARNIIMKKQAHTRVGSLKNIFGLPIEKNASNAEKLAHLIQGVEASALKSVLDLNQEEIVLVQHDGFTSTRLLNIESLQGQILQATGYNLMLEVEQINLDLNLR